MVLRGGVSVPGGESPAGGGASRGGGSAAMAGLVNEGRACPVDHPACCAATGRAPRCVVVVAHRNHYGLLLRLAMHPAGGRSQRHRSTGHALLTVRGRRG